MGTMVIGYARDGSSRVHDPAIAGRTATGPARPPLRGRMIRPQRNRPTEGSER